MKKQHKITLIIALLVLLTGTEGLFPIIPTPDTDPKMKYVWASPEKRGVAKEVTLTWNGENAANYKYRLVDAYGKNLIKSQDWVKTTLIKYRPQKVGTN